eukprot:CAMPEP_0197258824 /NCGR_PEP_ID=MMETSP1429-20130617/83202_1 /TAXON_ID=49237 /ORGANISM="Chaetoceros  sp., Strain UNC1202" /LENGTH=235 /DNA_ID=CAMNT_0042723011 /DNA_START=77 /DNA_END=784 /DNA_ORIENTATION=-
MSANTAPIKWAQRSDSLYITINIPDVKDETINLTDTELHFKGTSESKPYEVNIKFFHPIDSEAKGSSYKVLSRSVQMQVLKKPSEKKDDDDEEFWPRLLEDKLLEKNQVKIDWDRYVDEDEEAEAGGFDTSNLEGGNMMGGGMPGMPGMGGGMPGMPGMGGGMPGMPGMGEMPGMGGAGDAPMDMMSMMKQLQGMGGMPEGVATPHGTPFKGKLSGGGDAADSGDDSEGDLPDLE